METVLMALGIGLGATFVGLIAHGLWDLFQIMNTVARYHER